MNLNRPAIFRLFLVTVCCLLLLSQGSKAQQKEISLAGDWKFTTDPTGKGLTEKWFTQSFPEQVKLPGSMAENLKGNDITLKTEWTASIYDSSWFYNPRMARYREPGNIKVPFWLTPAKHYVGPAWYQKEVTIPASWKDKRIVLELERAHIATHLWIDEQEIGKANSLVAPHLYDLTGKLAPGKHTITLRVDNTITEDVNVGTNSHSISDHTQGNWNGVVGNLMLKAGSKVYFDDIQVFPNLKTKTASVKLTLQNTTDKPVTGKVSLGAKSFNSDKTHAAQAKPVNVKLNPGETVLDINLPLGENMQTWDEFNPALYKLTAKLDAKGNQDDEQGVQFGMREISVEGTRIMVNGKPVFLRGDLNNSEFPLTGYPPTDEASWERIYKIAKAHGLNHIRFHSWCPPEAAFIAADKIGIYLQPEGPTWPNHSTSLGSGKAIDTYIYEETNRMAKHYGNYASFTMLAAGNEPRGGNQAKYLAEFVKYWQKKDNRRIYTGASVAMSWPLVPENEFMVKSGPRGLNWPNARPENEGDYRTKIEGFTVPYVTHEMGQWVAFPNFEEIKKYTGVYRAKNFELFQEDLADRGMGDQARDFLTASGKLQALSYKFEIEQSLRTPGLAGFQLLGLQDFPGQGTALVGVLDAFWESKGYISPEEFRRFCNTTVPLTRMAKFVYKNNEVLTANVELYHFGESDLTNAILNWELKDDKNNVVASGSLPAKAFPRGANTEAGKLEIPLTKITKASKLNLFIKLAETNFVNDWNVWVYPAEELPVVKSDVYYTKVLDKKAEEVLNRGGSVFLDAAGSVVKGKEVMMYFTPAFWNTSWFKMRPPHTTGSLIKADHPAFEYFPTESFTDLQWWEVVNRAQVMHLEDFPKDFRPIVQPIDTWFMNRKLGLIYEASVGKGKLLVSSADLTSDLDNRPAARQLRYSLLSYMASDKFQPKDKLDMELVRDVFQTPSREVWDSFTKDSPDELKPNQGQQPVVK
ncbi:beta-glucuronidase [Pontibacter qinzhouensis]|uniref:beta-galactosidase n=1 Tax=Pontibacter qinzhouensis TaxID=2603253 RepID=A0A5C8KB42_9BACT|nr:sugar-binding domain-containing protein [Pontibacter qinzhouensis]TXK49346.1 beta-glucuronidase [Pontibacter qinzhouensis]